MLHNKLFRNLFIGLITILILFPSLFLTKLVVEDNILGVSVITNYQTQLRSPMTSSQTTVPVASLETTDGVVITTELIDSAVYLVASPGKSDQEIIKCTTVTATDFTNCTRGLAFSGTDESTVSTNRHPHSASTKIVMTDVHFIFNRLLDLVTTNDQSIASNITFSTGTVWLGDGTTTKDKTILANNGDSSLPFFSYDESVDGWVFSNDGVTTINMATSTGSGLTASTTRAIGITNSAIHVNASSTLGFAFDSNGFLYLKTQTATGIEANSNGLWINTSTLMGLIGSETSSTDKFVQATSDGLIDPTWLGGSATGSFYYSNGTNLIALPKGTAGQSIVMNSGATAPEWGVGSQFDSNNSSRASGSGTGTQTIGHNLGRIPVGIIINTFGESSSYNMMSYGAWNTNRQTSISKLIHSSYNGLWNTNKVIYLRTEDYVQASASISAISDSSFILSWDVFSSSIENVIFQWSVY